MKIPHRTLNVLAVIASLSLLCGCASTRPLRGGQATTRSKPAQGIEQSVVQSDNPAQTSRQDQETVKTKTYTVPTGSRLEESRVTTSDAGAVVTNLQSVAIGAPIPTRGLKQEDVPELVRRARAELIALHRNIGGLGGDEQAARNVVKEARWQEVRPSP